MEITVWVRPSIHVFTVPGPQVCPSRSARQRNCSNLKPYPGNNTNKNSQPVKVHVFLGFRLLNRLEK